MFGQWVRRKLGKNAENSILPLNLTTPEVIEDFASLATTELAQMSVCPLTNGGQLMLDPQDLKAAFSQKNYSNQPSRFSALAPHNSSKYVAAQVAANIPPFLDAPRHTVVRKWLSKAIFANLTDFRPKIPQAAQLYVSDLPRDEPLLLVETVARGFAIQTICDFVGVELEQADLKRYTAAMFKLFAPIHDAEEFARTNHALAASREALRAQLVQASDQKTSLFSTMNQFVDLLEDLSLTEDEKQLMFCDNALLVLADGVENVEAAIGEVLLKWAEAPENERTEITESFVRDAIHTATPGQTIARIATNDMHLAGVKCPAGSPVFLSLASANARSTDAIDFSFGLGRHRCIGEGLAISVILACCQEIAKHTKHVDTSNLRFEPVFGHRWMRDTTIELADAQGSKESVKQ